MIGGDRYLGWPFLEVRLSAETALRGSGGTPWFCFEPVGSMGWYCLGSILPRLLLGRNLRGTEETNV